MIIVDFFWLLILFQKSAFANQNFDQKYVVATLVILITTITFYYCVSSFSKVLVNLNSNMFSLYATLLSVICFFLVHNMISISGDSLEVQISLTAVFLLVVYGILFPSVVPLEATVNKSVYWASFFVLINLPLLFIPGSYIDGRWGGIYSNPAIFAGILPFLSAIFVFCPQKIRRGLRTFFVSLLLLFSIASGSRGAFAMICLILFLNIFLSKKLLFFGVSFGSGTRNFLAFLAICLAPLLVMFFIALAQGYIDFGSRNELTNAFQDRAHSRRYTSIENLQLGVGSGFSRKFVLDEGQTKFNIEADSHNLFLTTASSIGVVPGILLCGIVASSFLVTLFLASSSYKNLFIAWTLPLLLSSFVGGSMFSLSNSLDRLYWVIIGYSFTWVAKVSRPLLFKPNRALNL